MSSLMKNKNFRYIIIYLGVTLLSLLTCAIYYIFSHGEKDIHMTLLFLPGAISMNLFITLFTGNSTLNNLFYYLFNSAFIFFWAYMCLKGIYEIAYMESRWLYWFYIIAAFLLAGALISQIVFVIKNKKNKKIEK